MHYHNFLDQLVFILLLLLLCNGEAASRASFGENCSKELRCESRNFLTCSPTENICVCLMPDTMTFEESSGNCVALAGERCQYLALEGERTWSDEIPCIWNAACVNGICECTSNYFEVANGTCLRKGDFGEKCSSESMCSSDKHVICGPEQTCVCEDKRLLDGGDCRLKAGQMCNPHISEYKSQCFHLSRCLRDSRDYEYRCTCETPYFSTFAGLCERKRDFGHPCSEDSQCDNERLLRCNQNTKTCDCNDGFGYHPLQNQCRNSPNAGSCSDDNDCVPNAKCYYSSGSCQCKSGSQLISGYCLVSENHSCDDDIGVDSVNVIVNGQITDQACLPGLVCRDSRCSCLYKDHQVYDKSGTGLCVSLVSGPCNDTSGCTRNSECLPNKAGLMECQCKEGFIQAGRHCDLAYGEKCSQGNFESICDRYGPLECSVRRICECSEFQIYDNNTLKCRGLVGATCGVFEDLQMLIRETGRNYDNYDPNFCVDGATCKPFRGVKSGVCACQDGKVLGANRTCISEVNVTETVTLSSRTRAVDEY